MVNIPRRMIYETMLEFEDALLGIEALVFEKPQFEELKTQFIENSLPKLQDSYQKIKALLIMFFENETFSSQEEFDEKLKFYLNDIPKINTELKNNKNLPNKFKTILPKIDQRIVDSKILVKNYEDTKSNLELLDAFNHYIPKILEIRRDDMK